MTELMHRLWVLFHDYLPSAVSWRLQWFQQIGQRSEACSTTKEQKNEALGNPLVLFYWWRSLTDCRRQHSFIENFEGQH